MSENSEDATLVYFRSVNREVRVIGESAPWEGIQGEIDYFQFHAERVGKLLDFETPPTICYQADGCSYAYAPNRNETGVDGVYAQGLVSLAGLLAEVG